MGYGRKLASYTSRRQRNVEPIALREEVATLKEKLTEM